MGGFANNAPIVTDGLVFYVDAGNSKSYDGVSGGTTWTDLVGGNNGTLTNMETNPANAGYAYDSGNGGSLVFDGVDDFSNYGNDVFFDFNENDALSIQFWMKSDRNNEFQAIIGRRETSSPNEGWEVGMGPSSDRSQLFAVFNSNVAFSRKSAVSTTFNYVADTWRNVAITYDGSGNASGWSFYSDGTSVGQSVSSNSSFSTSVSTTANFCIGGRNSGSMHGNVAAVKIYNRELSLSEITQNYNALKNRFV